MRTTAMLGGRGHITIGWSPEDDGWVLKMIQKKLAENCTFWVRGRRSSIRITKVSEIGAAREVVIDDKDAEALLANRHVFLVADNEDEVVAGKKLTKPEEIVSRDTLMLRPSRGG